MNRYMTIIAGLIGLVLGVVVGYFVFNKPDPTQTGIDAGNYCCAGASVDSKCIKQTGVCPGDKPVVVSVP